MYKTLIRTEDDFDIWISGMKKDKIYVSDLENYPPEKYPCLIAYFLKNVDSMTYAEDCIADYIYLSDFIHNECSKCQKEVDNFSW
jgi:hypothetical protein